MDEVENLLDYIKQAYNVGIALHREDSSHTTGMGLNVLEMNAPPGSAQLELEELNIVYCTEDLHFGRYTTGSTKESVSVHVPSDDVLAAIKQAYSTKSMVSIGILIVTPLFVSSNGACNTWYYWYLILVSIPFDVFWRVPSLLMYFSEEHL